MNNGGLQPNTQVTPGDRGLTTIRHISEPQFQNVFKNIVGFEEAYLCWSNHHVWGATEKNGSRVLEAYINLDLVANSYAIDRGHTKPRLVINESFIDRIKWIFYIFYDSENSKKFTANSTLAKSFEDVADLDWRKPEVIVIYIQFKIDGQGQIFPIMENSNDWNDDEEEVTFDSGDEYIDYCSQRYSTFLANYMQYFDENGQSLTF